MPVRSVNVEFRHQQQIEHAVTLVRTHNNDRAASRSMGHEVWMRDFDCAAISHPNCKWDERNLMQDGLKSLRGHTAILPPR